MSSTPCRMRAESRFDGIVNGLRPLAARTLAATAVSRFVLALIPLQLKYLLDPLLKCRWTTIAGIPVSPTTVLAIMVVSGFLIAAVRGVSNYVIVATAGQHGHQLVARLRFAMFEHIMRIPASFARSRGTGKILLRFIGDSDSLRTWYSRKRPAVIVDRWLAGILVLVMLAVDWRLTLVVLLPLPLIAMLVRRITPILAQQTLDARQEQARLSGEIGHRFDSIEQAKWLDRNQGNREFIYRQTQKVATLNADRERQSAWLQGLGQFLAFTSVPLLLLAGVQLAWHDMISLGQCVAFMWLTAHLAVAIHRINAAVVIREKARVSRARILKLMERKSEPNRSDLAPEFVPGTGGLRLDKVVFANAREGELPVSMEFDTPGIWRVNRELLRRIVMAVGGYGKIQAGDILLDGQSISSVGVQSVRRQIGWIMEHPMIVPATIRENLLMADPSISPESLEYFCRPLERRFGKGWLDTVAGLHGQNLTPAETVAISMIRAAIGKPPFVFVELNHMPGESAEVFRELYEDLADSSIVLVSDAVHVEITESVQQSVSQSPEFQRQS